MLFSNECHLQQERNPMSEDQQREAKRWFIDRFIHSAFGHQFANRLHGLEPIPIQKEFNRSKKRFPTLDFSFLDEQRGLVIVANHPDAAWAEGLIFIDNSGKFQYVTGKIVVSRDFQIPDPPSL